MTLRVLLILVLLGSFFPEFKAQSAFIQFRVEGLSSDSLCRLVEQEIRTQTGWHSVRAESHTQNVLAIFPSSQTFSSVQIQSWLEPFGLWVKCVRSGLVGQNAIVRLNVDCDDSSAPQRERIYAIHIIG